MRRTGVRRSRKLLCRLALPLLLCAGLTGCGELGTDTRGTQDTATEGTGSQGAGQASCAAVVEYDGAVYYGHGDLKRVPAVTGRVVRGVVPSCDDSGGQVPSEPAAAVELAELADLPLRTAVLLGGTLFVREGHVLPARAARWFHAPACATAGVFAVTGDWLGVTGPKELRVDGGDLRPPYRVELRVTDGPSRYLGTTIRVHADAQTSPRLGERDVKTSLWQGGQVAARVACTGRRFGATSLWVPAT